MLLIIMEMIVLLHTPHFLQNGGIAIAIRIIAVIPNKLYIAVKLLNPIQCI